VDLTNGVTGDLPFANLAQGSALSVLGVTGNATADNASIAAASDHQVLRRSGTAVAFGAVNLAQSAAITGALLVANGGTGLTTFAQGDVIYASALDTVAGLTKDANATRYLANTGASNNPAWAQVALATGVSGDLPFANLTQASAASRLLGRGSAAGGGDYEEITVGSGLTMTATTLSANAGGTNALLDGVVHTDTLAAAVSRGSIIYGNATPAWAELVVGSANRVLRTDGTDVAWAQVALATDVSGDLPFANLAQGAALSVLGVTGNAGADVASIEAASDHQVLRRSGTAVAFGAVNLAQAAAITGTLPVGNGGTGVATFTSNGVLYGNAATSVLVTAQGAANSVLTANAGAPSFSATPTIESVVTTGRASIGAVLFTEAQLRIGGTFTPASGDARAIAINSTLNPSVDADSYGIRFATTMVEAGSGTHPVFAQVRLDAPTITVGVAALTTAATLYIEGQPSGATNNYSLYVATGTGVRWAGYGAGAATFDASGNISSVSDLRAKEAIQPYTSGLAAIRELRPIKYRWTEATHLDRGRTYVGFGAQDVLPWLPDAVDQHWLPDKTDPTKIGQDEYSLNTQVILAALVNAVQELETRLDAVDNRITPSLVPVVDLSAAIGFDVTKLHADDRPRRMGTGRFPQPEPRTRL
jgi:hypothetical protein